MKKKSKTRQISMSVDFSDWIDKQSIPNFSGLVCSLLKNHLKNGKEITEEDKLNHELESLYAEKKELNAQLDSISFRLEMLVPKRDLLMKRLFELDPIKYKHFKDFLFSNNLIKEELNDSERKA